MKLLIGLGNPGSKYELNRHNVGKMLIGKIGETGEIRAIASENFMNDSGRFVSEKFNFYKISLDDLYIAHDDLDIPLGQYKIQKGVGPKVHNGVLSIENALNTKDFWRIRIGIDNRNNQDTRNKIQGEDYVLQNFADEEFKILEGVFDAITKDSHIKN